MKFIIIVVQNLWGATQPDVDRFVNDTTGRNPEKATGTESFPEERRIWAPLHKNMHDNLARIPETNLLASLYQKNFLERLDRLQSGSVIRIEQFLKEDMARAALTTLAGSRIFEISPNILDLMWDFDVIAASLAWGLPKWLNSKAVNCRDRFHEAVQRYLETSIKALDWDGPEAQSDWEPNFGSRFSRTMVRIMIEKGFDMRSMAGGFSNTIVYGYVAHFP